MRSILLKLNKIRIISVIALSLNLLNQPIIANTEDIQQYEQQHICKVSNTVTNNYEPQTFNITNNLLRISGQKSDIHSGIIIIKGTLLDKNCVPVFNAKIFLWQVSDNGKYPYIPLRDAIDHSLISTSLQHADNSITSSGNNTNYHSTFLGSGITTTDNNGNFCFVTIYPAAVHDLSPHFNFRIEHQELGTLQTRYIIGDNEMSNNVSRILYNSSQMRSKIISVNNYLEEYITIVMPKASKVKRY